MAGTTLFGASAMHETSVFQEPCDDFHASRRYPFDCLQLALSL